MNKYIDVKYFDDSNCNGYSITVFFAKCPHMCEGCHNPSTWRDSGAGEDFTKEVQNDIIKHFEENKKYYDSLVLSGGDPMCEDNLEYVLEFSKLFKENFPDKEIWLYTGYTFKQVKENKDRKNLLMLCDYIKCGRYIEELKTIDNIEYDIRLATSNQHIYKKGLDY